jgi:hypothetical protein
VNDFAKYSGKGTPMKSRRGKATISHYACFKQCLTDYVMKATAMKPAMDAEIFGKIKARD